MTSETRSEASPYTLRARLRAMETNCSTDPQCQEAQQMFDELFAVAVGVAATAFSHTFDEHAAAQLENHYKKQFYYALKVKGKKFTPDEEKTLLGLAVALATKCVEKAKARLDPPPNGVIMRQDVHAAIFEVDCPPVLSTMPHARLKLLFEWCN